MARAEPGQILSTAPVLAASPVEFETTALEPFLVKGKRLPVEAFAVGAISGARRAGEDLPLVGRDDEITGWSRRPTMHPRAAAVWSRWWESPASARRG